METILRAGVRSFVLMTTVILSLVVGGAVAQAKPPVRPGAISNLSASITKPAGSYLVATAWTASSNTTSYAVRLTTASGVVLDSAVVTAPAWTGSATGTAGSTVTVTVTPSNGTRKGQPASVTKTLPDLMVPTGSFTVSGSAFVGTITQTSLADDVSLASAIMRTVDWGDGSPLQAWSAGATLDHAYAEQGRYLPSVLLVDEAGNTATLALNAIVIDDTTAPTGAYSSTPATAWSSYTKVALTQLALADDFSPAAFIARAVEWGDGDVTAWPTDTVLSHVYLVPGTYTPTVVMVDEAGNTGVAVASAVSAVKDVVAPAIHLALPKVWKAYIASWKVLKGTATDTGTGVRQVRVKAVQKRGTTYYAYRALTKTWVKAGTRKAAAWRRASVVSAKPGASGAWKVSVKGLKLGTLSYSVKGVDMVSNVSRAVVHSQKLKHS